MTAYVSMHLGFVATAGPALEALGGRLKKMKIKASGPKVVMSAVAS